MSVARRVCRWVGWIVIVVSLAGMALPSLLLSENNQGGLGFGMLFWVGVALLIIGGKRKSGVPKLVEQKEVR